MNIDEYNLHMYDVVQWAKGECLQIGINSGEAYRICRVVEGPKGLEVGVANMEGEEKVGSWPESAWELIKRWKSFTSESEAVREALWSKGDAVQISNHNPQGQLHGQEATIKAVIFAPVPGGCYTPAYYLDQFEGTHQEQHLDLLRKNNTQPLRDPMECVTVELNPFKQGDRVRYTGPTETVSGYVSGCRAYIGAIKGIGVRMIGCAEFKPCADFEAVEIDEDADTTKTAAPLITLGALDSDLKTILAQSDTEFLPPVEEDVVSGDISTMSQPQIDIVLEVVAARVEELKRQESEKRNINSMKGAFFPVIGHAYQLLNGSIGLVIADEESEFGYNFITIWESGKTEELYKNVEDLGTVGVLGAPKSIVGPFNPEFIILVPNPKAD